MTLMTQKSPMTDDSDKPMTYDSDDSKESNDSDDSDDSNNFDDFNDFNVLLIQIRFIVHRRNKKKSISINQFLIATVIKGKTDNLLFLLNWSICGKITCKRQTVFRAFIRR